MIPIAKYLANIDGGSYLSKIGVGDSGATPVDSDEALLGSNVLIKSVTDKTYVRPIAYMGVEYNFEEANYTWREYGLYNDDDDLVARVLESPAYIKSNSNRAIVEWQVEISNG